jgi:hypothetical protein
MQSSIWPFLNYFIDIFFFSEIGMLIVPPLAGAGCTIKLNTQFGVDKSRIELRNVQECDPFVASLLRAGCTEAK